MCNPRRVEITATRELNEAWEREVRRTAQVSEEIAGEARIRQSLGESLGEPVLRALEMTLVEGARDWQELEEGGYRHAVDGGWVIYHPEEQELEIVAVRHGRITAEGSATETLRGEVDTEISAQGVGHWDDEEIDGATLSRAERMAELSAERALRAEAAKRLEEAADAAESEQAAELSRRAEEEAHKHLETQRDGTREKLEEDAKEHLETVGLRCRQAFYRLLGRAYRDALLAYARQHGAEIVTQEDDGEVLEIELNLSL